MECLSPYYFAISGDHFYEVDVDIDYQRDGQDTNSDAENTDDSISEKNND